MGLSTTHLLIFLAIIVVIFGTKKLRNIGADLGAAVKGFKDGMKNGGEKTPEADHGPTLSEPPQVGTSAKSTQSSIDVPVKAKD